MAEPVWDIVVVGGGPAGSTTAALAAGAGHRVLLLDREDFPRRKPCGESINPGAVRELHALGLLSLVTALPHGRISGWRVQSVRSAPFEGHFHKDTAGLGVDRALLDQALLRNAISAGAVVRTGAHVVDLVRVEGRIAGVRLADGEEITARFVVGADGLRSVVVRRLGLLGRAPILKKVALTAHVESEWPSANGALQVTSWGCVGIAPVGSGLLNVVVVLNEGHRAGGDPTGTFDRLRPELPALRSARRVSNVQSTGPFDFPTRGVVAPGAMLVGDAAGYFDPFTGQGIFAALRGARLAAVALDRSLREGHEATNLARYQAEHRETFGRGRRIQRMIESIVARPAALRAASAVLRRLPAAADRLIAITGDMHAVFFPAAPVEEPQAPPVFADSHRLHAR